MATPINAALPIEEQPPGETAETDEALVRLAQQDRAAFTPLYRRYAARVYRYTYSRVGSTAEAEDLTSQVFADALASLPRYRARSRFAGWLFTLAYRRCADFHRKPPTDALPDQIASSPEGDPAEQVLRRETLYRLEELLAVLPEAERELLRLRYAAGLSHREIADVLGRSEAAVKMAHSRLLHQLKLHWEVES